jgi:hypothetical protein
LTVTVTFATRFATIASFCGPGMAPANASAHSIVSQVSYVLQRMTSPTGMMQTKISAPTFQ